MKAKAIGVTGLFVLLLSFRLPAQDSAGSRHAAATNQLKQLAAALSASCLNDVRTLSDWQKQRAELRRQLLDMLGLDPLPARTPLKAEITGRLERELYRIEKIVFQSSPGLYVTGNFYVPKGAARPLPTILYLCGHAPHPLGAKFQYQDRAIWFASHGFACLILDTHEFGELAGIHHGTHDLNMWHWLSLGYTPAGLEVWNAMRALDYLETRPEVDAKRIGLTGISGGGAMTWYTAAVDERIAAAAPVCSTITWGSQAEHWRAGGQCDCIYYHNSYRWDFPVVAALIAPRPLLILSGQRDADFPPDGYHEVFRRGKRVYDFYAGGDGKSERIREVDADVGHSDPPLFLREARQWMQRWLKDDATPLPLETNSPPRETAEALACLAKIPDDAVNFRIQNEFAPQASLKTPPSRAAWQQRRAEVISRLKDKVFGWFPTEPVAFETRVSGNTGGWHARYADYKDCSFQSEAGVRVRAQLFSPKTNRAGAPLLIYVKQPGASFAFSDVDELLPVFGHDTVLILNPRLTELSLTAAEYADVERTAAWVGRTIAAMQVWDTLRAVEWAIREQGVSAPSISIYGKGEMGIVALYAALFDDRVRQVILNNAPGSHWQGPALLNILRVTDLAEVAGALAPRRLVALRKFPDSFEPAREIYRLERASEQFIQSPSLPEALEIWKYPQGNRARPGPEGARE